MEEKHTIEQTAAHLKQYAETKWNLIRLDMSNKISSTVSSLASVVLIGVLSTFVLLFASIGAAWWIGQQNNNLALGFFIVGGFYFVMVIILYALRENFIKIPVINGLLKILHANDKD